MRGLTREGKLVLLCLAFVLAFALGLILGAKVEQGIGRAVAGEVR